MNSSLPAPAALDAAQLAVIEFTTISLVIQWVGTLVIGGLLLFLTQSIRRRFLDDWAAAWCSARTCRIISARRATRHEQDRYYADDRETW
jgi:uncharacterized membrane protein YbhN (UPF0104 family)